MLDDTISDLQWDIRKLERNLEVYQGESKLSDRDREIKGEFEREFSQKQKELQTLLQRKSELEKQLPEEQCSGKQNAGYTDYSEKKHGR